MKSIEAAFFFTLLSFTIAVAEKQNLMTIGPYAQVSDRQIRRDLGIVKNVRSCGGSAKVVQWRYESCLESDPVCQVPLATNSKLMTGQVDFVPSHNIENPALRFILTNKDDNISHVVANPSVISAKAVLEKGHMYTVTAFGNSNKEIAGKVGVFQFILYDSNNNDHVEFCAEADFKFI